MTVSVMVTVSLSVSVCDMSCHVDPEQLLFSCLCSKVTVYRRKCHCARSRMNSLQVKTHVCGKTAVKCSSRNIASTIATVGETTQADQFSSGEIL